VVSFTVVYDACVLYPASVRDLVVELARTGLLRAKWTSRIMRSGSTPRFAIDLNLTALDSSAWHSS
jgi:hypothetical protein